MVSGSPSTSFLLEGLHIQLYFSAVLDLILQWGVEGGDDSFVDVMYHVNTKKKVFPLHFCKMCLFQTT